LSEEDKNGKNSFDLGAITGNWAKNIAFEGKADKDGKRRIADYYSQQGAVKSPSSFFYEKNALDIFLLAMAVGKSYGIRTKLVKKALNLPKNSLTEKQTWAMIAVALAEDESDIFTLKNGTEIYRICEEYANGGIEQVIDWDIGGVTGDTNRQFREKFEEFLQDK
jgi:hypothetical protein